MVNEPSLHHALLSMQQFVKRLKYNLSYGGEVEINLRYDIWVHTVNNMSIMMANESNFGSFSKYSIAFLSMASGFLPVKQMMIDIFNVLHSRKMM